MILALLPLAAAAAGGGAAVPALPRLLPDERQAAWERRLRAFAEGAPGSASETAEAIRAEAPESIEFVRRVCEGPDLPAGKALAGTLASVRRELGRAAEAARPALADPDPDERARAARAIGRTGDPGDAALLLALVRNEEEDARVRVSALAGLAAGPGGESVDAVLGGLRGGSAALRGHAEDAFLGWAERRDGFSREWVERLHARAGEAVADPVLAGSLARLAGGSGNPSLAFLAGLALGSRDEAARVEGMRAIRRLRRPEGLEQASRSLAGDAAAAVRAVACEALADGGWEESVPALAAALDDPEPAVRTAAHRALQEITGRRLASSRLRWEHWIAVEQPVEETAALAALEGAFSAGAAERAAAVREAAARAAGMRRGLLRHLEGLLSDASAAVRAAVVEALTAVRRPEAVPLLVRALGDGDASVREAALAALKRTTGKSLPADPDAWARFWNGD